MCQLPNIPPGLASCHWKPECPAKKLFCDKLCLKNQHIDKRLKFKRHHVTIVFLTAAIYINWDALLYATKNTVFYTWVIGFGKKSSSSPAW